MINIKQFLKSTETLDTDLIHVNTVMFVLSMYREAWSNELYEYLRDNHLNDFISKEVFVNKIKELIRK